MKIKCKFCGLPVEGIPVLKDSALYKISEVLNQGSAALMAISSGNPIGALTSMQTGKKITEVENQVISKAMGGQEYHFECEFCHQSFNKVVY